MSHVTENYDFVVVGGGIAGICCAESLCHLNENRSVAVISSSPLIKKIVNYKRFGHLLGDFDVTEATAESIEKELPHLKVILDDVIELKATEHVLKLASGQVLTYEKVCICAGAKPKLLSQENPYVVGIRDTDSAKNFQSKMETARRVVIVGNGGIAMEIAYEITGCEVVWVVREESVNIVFLDAAAAQFVLSHIQNKPEKDPLSKRSKYTLGPSVADAAHHRAAALGPDWHERFSLSSAAKTCEKKVTVEYDCEVAEILSIVPEDVIKEAGSWPIYLRLTNSKIIGADLVVSATGVRPDPGIFLSGNNLTIDERDGGILVDGEMRTSEPDVYAAGDVCMPGWEYPPRWIHMRLWSQARTLGLRAAQCMTVHVNAVDSVSEPIELDISMELFTHVTRFCGFKVVLLGLFNGQRLPHHEVLLRIEQDVEYVKAIVANGRLMGALLIGDTDLDETFENLMLNDLPIDQYGESLLDPDIDLTDYFD